MVCKPRHFILTSALLCAFSFFLTAQDAPAPKRPSLIEQVSQIAAERGIESQKSLQPITSLTKEIKESEPEEGEDEETQKILPTEPSRVDSNEQEEELDEEDTSKKELIAPTDEPLSPVLKQPRQTEEKEVQTPAWRKTFEPEQLESSPDVTIWRERPKNFAEKAAFSLTTSAATQGLNLQKEPPHLDPWNFGNPDELVEFNFKDAELRSILTYIQDQYNITFMLDEILNPLPAQSKKIEGIRLSFKTETPLSKKDAWGLFVTFLKMAGFAIVPTNIERLYRVTTLDQKAPFGATNSPLPTFIGINPAKLPNDDTLIRYVYFARNTSLDAVKNLFDMMKSQTSPRLIIFPDIRAVVITDHAYNIKTMLEIVDELDHSTAPEVMAIVRLNNGDANEIAAFYSTIVKEEEQAQRALSTRLMGPRTNTLSYLPTGIRIIPEPRTNSLILLGSETGVKKVQNFITEVLDRPSDLPFKFTKVYHLKNIEAEAAAAILSRVVNFKPGSDAAQSGSVRSGDQYFGPINIVPEASTNQLIITCSYPEWLKLEELLREIDVEQPQVALRVFIANIDVSKAKELGTQLRNSKPMMDGLLGNISFQTSGLRDKPIVENTATGTPGAMRLLGDLVNLAVGAPVGSTYLTLGNDAWGVFLLLQMLEEYTSASITQTPFVMVTNNYRASISLGEKRSVISQYIYDSSGTRRTTYKDDDANLSIEITPRISYEGYITLNIKVHDDQFTGAVDSGDKNKKEVITTLTVANKETAVLGGFLQDTENEHEYHSNPLSKIPLVGWLFGKVRAQSLSKSSLLIFITPEVIPPSSSAESKKFTQAHIEDLQKTLNLSKSKSSLMDPIHRWMFESEKRDASTTIKEFLEKENRYIYPNQKQAKKRQETWQNSKPLGSFL
ncbi:TPA: hypothetical protein DCW54_03540 [Candidatus Dependentiae bacterium]|nr:hypothetical protein [Candidatus Dependentiae bacterium]